MNAASNIAFARPRFHLPVMRGVIERRVLVNYRCDPETVAKLLPGPFRPKLVDGFAVAGICLIRLGGVHPGFMPAGVGLSSENAAHRIAVEWDEGGAVREGVFIPRRDTNSRLNRLVGGRLFPGVHHAADFQVWETDNRFKIEMRSADRETFVRVLARVAKGMPPGSVFPTLDAASRFFLGGALGWSTRSVRGEFDGLELCCTEWQMEPLTVKRIESSFFDDVALFPPGTAIFDSAFLMHGIPHEWRARERMEFNGGERP